MLTALCVAGIVIIIGLTASLLGKHFALQDERLTVDYQRATIAAHVERMNNDAEKIAHLSRQNSDLTDRIALGKAQNDRLLSNLTEIRSERARAETQLMHALATMDSANKKYAEVEDRYAAHFHAFKKTADEAFINAAELREQNRGLLETVSNATSQLVTIAQEFAGLRRVGFVRGAEVAVNDHTSSEPAKFGSTSEADEAAAKTRGAHVVIDAND